MFCVPYHFVAVTVGCVLLKELGRFPYPLAFIGGGLCMLFVSYSFGRCVLLQTWPANQRH
jgi:hypothetical protein